MIPNSGKDRIPLIVDMRADGCAHSFLIAFFNALINLAVFRIQALMTACILQIFQAVAVHLFPQVIQNLHELLVFRAVVDDVMVPLVCLGNPHGIAL